MWQARQRRLAETPQQNCFPRIRTVAFFLTLALLQSGTAHRVLAQDKESSTPVVIAVHGGAGTISREKMTPELEREYRSKLGSALRTGHEILSAGGTALDAVEATIRLMEDSPLFNAGKGAVFTSDGTNELDAAIMDGETLEAGSVSGVKHIRNPISLARLVMEKSPHVTLVGDGAEEFASQQGVKRVSQYYFFTEQRWESLKKAKTRSVEQDSNENRNPLEFTDKKHGTVGAVALDKNGSLAAATSTGGLTNKMYGRVGDTPIIGAGTYANNATCAVSGTGQGEYFMRLLVGHDIHALMAYQNLSLAEAANRVVMQKLVDMGGAGGVVAVDRYGNISMPFNTSGMYRGYIDREGHLVVRIFKDEEDN